jgi:hypothetical protein
MKLLFVFAAFFIATCCGAQVRSADYGGLDSYEVPRSGGGSSEFSYCVTYAKRAWRVANMVEEGTATWKQAKEWARGGLGSNAAEQEINDFERVEKGELKSPASLGADRFYRCAIQLRLNPLPRHKENSDFCFQSIATLDLAARLRSDGKSQVQTRSQISRLYPKLGSSFIERTLNLAYSGSSLAEGSSLIEDTFSACFADAGERNASK